MRNFLLVFTVLGSGNLFANLDNVMIKNRGPVILSERIFKFDYEQCRKSMVGPSDGISSAQCTVINNEIDLSKDIETVNTSSNSNLIKNGYTFSVHPKANGYSILFEKAHCSRCDSPLNTVEDGLIALDVFKVYLEKLEIHSRVYQLLK